MIKPHLRSVALLLALHALPVAVRAQSALPDGRRDFDFEIGTWNTHVRILARPLSGSSEWIELKGSTVVRALLDGRSNIAELRISNAGRSIEGVSLRLYNPQTGQWSIHYANIKGGILDKPVVGSFEDGRGEFYAQDSYEGRAIFVRFVISPLRADTWRFEQAFSADGGRTWEVNWVATDTRVR
jgi:hypothetical protein